MFQTLISVGLPISLMLIMAGVGLSLTTDDFKRVARQPKGFLIGALAQMLLLPAVAVAIIALFDLSGALAIGLFILALCPGGVTSNMYTYLSRGDVGLSVSLTAVIGFITPFTIPLLAAWAISYYSDASQSFSLPLVKTWVQLLVISVIPVIIGMLINAKFHKLARKVEPIIGKFSVVVLAVMILAVCLNLGEKLVDFAIAAGPATLTLNITTMVLGYLLGKSLLHSEAQARTICLEVGLQNGTLALFIVATLLNAPQLDSGALLIAPSIYSLLMFITATAFAFFVRKRDMQTASA